MNDKKGALGARGPDMGLACLFEYLPDQVFYIYSIKFLNIYSIKFLTGIQSNYFAAGD